MADHLAVALVQRASDLDPAVNRAALDQVAELTGGASAPGLVVLPEASARDFGEPGSGLAPYAEPADGPYAQRLAEVAHGAVVVAGMFETAADERPVTTLLAVGPGVLAQ